MIQPNEGWVAASSSETVYVPLAECLQEVRYLHRILRELGGLHEPTAICGDNQPGMLWSREHGNRN